MIIKKELIKKCFISAIGVSVAFSTLFSSIAYAKEYEDKYATNSNIGSRIGEAYEALYELNNHSGTDQHVIMYFVRQNIDNVKQSDFTYQFEGKFDSEELYGTHLFEFDLGFPAEYKELSTVQLGEETGILHQVQFGIYPGYYNFHNYGYENYAGYSTTSACYIQTLDPSFELGEGYTEDPDIWVEVEEGSGDPRIYVIIGETSWIEKVSSDFEIWAQEYDSKIIANIADSSVQETIESEVSEENSENLLETSQPEVKVEEETQEESSVLEEKLEEPEAEDDFNVGPIAIGCGAVAGVIILGVALGSRKKK